MSDPVATFSLTVEQVEGFEFRVRFDKEQYAELRMDEPAPLGGDTAPNPARILAAAIANCLAASLLFCMKRGGHAPQAMRAEAQVSLVRNEQKRLRVGRIDVKLAPTMAPGGDLEAMQAALQKCLPTFEDFCVVTQSVRGGLDVRVEVAPVAG